MLPPFFTAAVRPRRALAGWWPWRNRPVRSATAAGVAPRPLDPLLDAAMGSVFRAIHELDALAERHAGRRSPVEGAALDAHEGLACVDTAGAEPEKVPSALADALRKTQDRLTDALEHMAGCAEGEGGRGAH